VTSSKLHYTIQSLVMAQCMLQPSTQVLHLFSKHMQTSRLPGQVVSGHLEQCSLVLFKKIMY